MGQSHIPAEGLTYSHRRGLISANSKTGGPDWQRSDVAGHVLASLLRDGNIFNTSCTRTLVINLHGWDILVDARSRVLSTGRLTCIETLTQGSLRRTRTLAGDIGIPK